MGIIKKLKGGELVGWTRDSNIDVYPITHISAIYDNSDNTLESILSGLQNSINNIQNSSIIYLLAYTNASNDAFAISKLDRDESVDIPTNYYSNTGVVPLGLGEKIYITTARKQGDTYLQWEDDHIWSSPTPMSNTTSDTGNDTVLYNYIYCVTEDDSSSNIPSVPSFNVEDIENLSPGQGLTPSGTLVPNDTGEPGVWRDHPIGVSSQYKCEWVCIAKKSNVWGAYQGPYLWSQFGIAGKDGDGVEFIFKIQAADAPAPTLTQPYNGYVGSIPYSDVFVTDPEYQQDDFIPTGWYDEPQNLTSENSVQYVSIRKREWEENDNDSKWRAFSPPTKWSEDIGAGRQGPKGAVLRNRGQWKDNNIRYCYNTDDEGAAPSDNNTVFIDVVYNKGHYYQCIETHQSESTNEPGVGSYGETYWRQADEFEFIATKVLVSDVADIKVLSSGSVVVFDDGISSGVDARDPIIVGGMTGGSSQSQNDVIIWAGDTYTNSANQFNPQIAPFRVYEDGSFYMADGLLKWIAQEYPTGWSSGNEAYNFIRVGDPTQYNTRQHRIYTNIGIHNWDNSNTYGDTYESFLSMCCLPQSNNYGAIAEMTCRRNTSSFRLENRRDSYGFSSYIDLQSFVNSDNMHGYTSLTLYASKKETQESGNSRANIWVIEGTAHAIMDSTGVTTSSDIRLKNIKENVSIQLDDIANAPLFKFTYKDNDDLIHIGTSAQYWKEILPQLVSKYQPKDEQEEYLSLDYTKAAFVAAITLAKEVQQLKAQVLELKNQLNNQ